MCAAPGPGGAAAERPRLVTCRGRTAAARRLPGRRQRSRAGRLRPLPSPATGRCGPPRAPRRGHDLADRSGLVRLRREPTRYRWSMDRPATIEHRSSRLGRRLRENRLRIALLVALVEGILVLVGSIDWWIVVLLAIIAVAAYVWRGRERGARRSVRSRGSRRLAARRRARSRAGAHPDGLRGRRTCADRSRCARRSTARPPLG